MFYGRIFTCEHCGAAYDLTETEVEVRDRGSFDCLECDERIYEWSGFVIPHFRLLLPSMPAAVDS